LDSGEKLSECPKLEHAESVVVFLGFCTCVSPSHAAAEAGAKVVRAGEMLECGCTHAS